MGPLEKQLSAIRYQRSGGKKKADPVLHSIPGGSNRVGKKRTASEGGPYTNCELSTVNCKLGSLTPAFTITSINIVGVPTFPFLDSYVEATFRWPPEGGRYISKERRERSASEGRALHEQEKPKSTGKNACATTTARETQDPPPQPHPGRKQRASQNEDGAPGRKEERSLDYARDDGIGETQAEHCMVGRAEIHWWRGGKTKREFGFRWFGGHHVATYDIS